MNKTLVEQFKKTNFPVLNSMEDWVRIVGPDGETLFLNKSLRNARQKSKELDLYLSETTPLNVSTNDDILRNTTVIEEKLISERYYSIKASPIYIEDQYAGTVEVFRDITRETNMKIELFEANRNMLDDIRFVRKVQSSILPKNKDYGSIDLNGLYVPSANVSGDLYDIIKIDEDRYAFYIADVMGHGVKASIMTMFIKVTMISIFEHHPDFSPAEALLKLRNKFFDLEIDTSQYFTAWLGIFDFKDKSLTFSNAGHNCPPMIYRELVKDCEYLHANGRMISNIIEPDVYNEIRICLKDNDKILFFTDGAVEATDSERKEFGLERLKESFCEHKDLDRVYKDIENFIWGEQEDDLTLVMINYKE